MQGVCAVKGTTCVGVPSGATQHVLAGKYTGQFPAKKYTLIAVQPSHATDLAAYISKAACQCHMDAQCQRLCAAVMIVCWCLVPHEV